jgi:hypothetical protein
MLTICYRIVLGAFAYIAIHSKKYGLNELKHGSLSYKTLQKSYFISRGTLLVPLIVFGLSLMNLTIAYVKLLRLTIAFKPRTPVRDQVSSLQVDFLPIHPFTHINPFHRLKAFYQLVFAVKNRRGEYEPEN